MLRNRHAEECPHCGGEYEDREKYRDIPIRGRVCTCDNPGSATDDGPSFTHWNMTIRSINPTLTRSEARFNP